MSERYARRGYWWQRQLHFNHTCPRVSAAPFTVKLFHLHGVCAIRELAHGDKIKSTQNVHVYLCSFPLARAPDGDDL